MLNSNLHKETESKHINVRDKVGCSNLIMLFIVNIVYVPMMESREFWKWDWEEVLSGNIVDVSHDPSQLLPPPPPSLEGAHNAQTRPRTHTFHSSINADQFSAIWISVFSSFIPQDTKAKINTLEPRKSANLEVNINNTV